LGSVAESVLRQVTIPMLLIRPTPERVAKQQALEKLGKLKISALPTQA